MVPRSWDIFCRVIDNYGDIGVSWRLARQLAAEHACDVRLWVDQLAALAALCPGLDVQARQQRVKGVTVCALDESAGRAQPASVVVEAFGCGLPPPFVAAMAASRVKPLWIVLEYLSAEPWVSAHHGLPSPHPRFALPRYFFFPGVQAHTGGVLREADLLSRRDAFDQTACDDWWRGLGFAPVARGAVAMSLFAYPHAPLTALLDACTTDAQPRMLALPATPLAAALRTRLGIAHATVAQLGCLEVRFLPFVAQPEYDRLLWACDVNFVRGEDSFARAQWAGNPFVWHIYPQQQGAHEAKLAAFLDALAPHLDARAAQAMRAMALAWNDVPGAPPLATAWPAFCAANVEIRAGLRHWRAHLLGLGDLAGNLVKFCSDKV
jgi:uncharacterized repeat protein (TIGR03837 family)